MRKFVLIALVALGATLQGEVCAKTNLLFTLNQTQQKIGEIELEWVLNQVVDQTGLTYSEARSQYESGEMTIEKSGGYYEVRYAITDGGMTTILIAEGF